MSSRLHSRFYRDSNDKDTPSLIGKGEKAILYEN